VSSVYAGDRALLEITITKDPDGYFRYISKINRKTGSNIELVIRSGCKTTTIDNITSLRVQSNISGAIGAGSKFILFKVRRA